MLSGSPLKASSTSKCTRVFWTNEPEPSSSVKTALPTKTTLARFTYAQAGPAGPHSHAGSALEKASEIAKTVTQKERMPGDSSTRLVRFNEGDCSAPPFASFAASFLQEVQRALEFQLKLYAAREIQFVATAGLGEVGG